MKNNFKVRKAKVDDAVAMKNIINAHAAHGLMRSKSVSRLLESLPHYFVAEIDGQIVGVCGFKIWPSEGVEIISSAVKSEYHGQGIGLKLNKECIKAAHQIGFTNFFVLTKQPKFYAKLGFQETPKEKLSIKIFVDCDGCSENKSDAPGKVICSDVAMVMRKNKPVIKN